MLHCGTGRRIINPELGHCLAGYGEDFLADGVHDDLTVTAMYLADGQREAILLVFDLVGMLAELSGQIRRAVSQFTGVSAEAVFTACTHTHSGPEVKDRSNVAGPKGPGVVRPDYNARLVDWSAQAAGDAKASAEPCQLCYNFTTAAGTMNRRYFFPDRRGLYVPTHKQLAGLSDQYVDRELGIVAFRKVGTANQYQAVVTNFAAHPLCVGNSSNQVSADYPGYLRRTVEETLAGCRCLTTTGAAGDLHPLLPESGFDSARRMGEALGRRVIARLYDAVIVDYDEQLRTAWTPIELPSRDVATGALLPTLADRDRLPYVSRQGAKMIRTAVSLLGIGPILLVGMPGEPVAELGAMIKWSSPFLKTYVLHTATDYAGYIVSTNQVLWGGMESANSPFALGAGERLVRCVLESADALLRERPLKLPPVA